MPHQFVHVPQRLGCVHHQKTLVDDGHAVVHRRRLEQTFHFIHLNLAAQKPAYFIVHFSDDVIRQVRDIPRSPDRRKRIFSLCIRAGFLEIRAAFSEPLDFLRNQGRVLVLDLERELLHFGPKL